MRIELVQVFFERFIFRVSMGFIAGALRVDEKYVEQVILFLYTLLAFKLKI